MPPRLPPRTPSQSSSVSSLNAELTPPRTNNIYLTPQAASNHPYLNHGGLQDPRTSSTQSLRPTEAPGPNRRTLLVVYIHGFLGDETSFRSFPAHVHSVLSVTLAETHVVHTKIYPRYRSRKKISFARDDFSNWLAPHESDSTDVVLAGHSLGGILGAEVVLIPSHTPNSRDAFQHRILGLVAFDTPFLGMHPGVVSTGIASLFRGAPDQPESPSDAASSSAPLASWQSFDTTSSDPNFNPTFNNDVKLAVRNNKWERAWYFWNKHYGELRKATQSYVKSHLEFGGCLADYPGLRRRYDAVRALEDVDDLERSTSANTHIVHRVRFLNYYTASTGRIKEQKGPNKDDILTTEMEMDTLKPPQADGLSNPSSRSSTPRLSLEEHREDGIVHKTNELHIDDDGNTDSPLLTLEPTPHKESEVEAASAKIPLDHDLPPLPPEPVPPSSIDVTQYVDQDAVQLAEKEFARQMKSYETAKKERQKATRDREKVVAKRERQIQKEMEKSAKAARLEEERIHKEKLKRQSTLNPENQDKQMRDDARSQLSAADKKKRDRKFCTLPSKDKHGQRDPTWVRVYMEGMDEVVAHTSLFFVSETYAKLVGDTADRIEQWVIEDATIRMVKLEQDRYG